MDIFSEIQNLDNNEIFIYIVLSLSILYFFTVLTKIHAGHIMALSIVTTLLYFMIFFKQNNTSDYYNTIQDALLRLPEEGKEDDIHYMYLDPDLVILFDEIKNDFYFFNKSSYNKALKAANNVLESRKAIETKMCPQPTVPNSLDLYTKELDLKSVGKCDKLMRNAYATFQFAEEQSKLCVNYLHSLILSIPATPSSHLKHKDTLDRARLLLKRNMDIIRSIYQKGTDLRNPQINYYDSFVPENVHTGNTGIDDNFTTEAFNFF